MCIIRLRLFTKTYQFVIPLLEWNLSAVADPGRHEEKEKKEDECAEQHRDSRNGRRV